MTLINDLKAKIGISAVETHGKFSPKYTAKCNIVSALLTYKNYYDRFQDPFRYISIMRYMKKHPKGKRYDYIQDDLDDYYYNRTTGPHEAKLENFMNIAVILISTINIDSANTIDSTCPNLLKPISTSGSISYDMLPVIVHHDPGHHSGTRKNSNYNNELVNTLLFLKSYQYEIMSNINNEPMIAGFLRMYAMNKDDLDKLSQKWKQYYKNNIKTEYDKLYKDNPHRIIDMSKYS